MLNHEESTHPSITISLNIQGWQHLDPILLAALAAESPLLLVGPHGTAKSLLVERIADALGLSMRHYNAALINYDDLVGIPLPEEGNESLKFVSTPGAIWDAEFVFFDEISRCRPDLQNKLYPIIHERKVVGISLDNLHHRWSAMNPPAPDDPDTSSFSDEYYLGSEPLDPALTDRFPFVVPVPAWNQLSKSARRRLIIGDNVFGDSELDGVEPELSLPALIEACVPLIPQIEEEYGEWMADYLVIVVDLLGEAKLPQSPRRARMLAQSILAVHAARLVLEGEDADLDFSAELALVYGLPQNATEVPPSQTTIVTAHKQAWEIASMIDDDAWRQVLEDRDLVHRVVLAEELEFSDEDMSRLVTQAFSEGDSEVRKQGLATAMFLAFRCRRNLTPAAWEPLVKYAGRVLEPRVASASIGAADMNIWNEIKEWAKEHQGQGELARVEVNYILSGFPGLWRNHNWKDALKRFSEDLELFGVKEV